MIGKFILKDGSIVDFLPKTKKVFGVIFDDTKEAYLILAFEDIDSHRSYDLEEIMDIAESYNQAYGNRYLQWHVPSFKEWNMIISRLGKTDAIGCEEIAGCDCMTEWTKFDKDVATKNLKKFGLTPETTYWSSTIEYDDEVYLFDLRMGVVEAYPVFDDGEPYDYSLRLVGKVIKKKIIMSNI